MRWPVASLSAGLALASTAARADDFDPGAVVADAVTAFVNPVTIGVGLAAVFGVGLAVAATRWAYSTVNSGIGVSQYSRSAEARFSGPITDDDLAEAGVPVRGSSVSEKAPGSWGFYTDDDGEDHYGYMAPQRPESSLTPEEASRENSDNVADFNRFSAHIGMKHLRSD